MRRTTIALALVGSIFATALALAQRTEPIETFTAFGASMQHGVSSTVTITLERWSTDSERQILLTTLREKGQAGLIAALTKLPRVGFIRLPNTRGRDLKYAWEFTLPDGDRRVVVATDRALAFQEVRGSTRSRNYDFAFAEISMPKAGKGEGKLAPANKIQIDPESGQIEIEHFGTQPVRLLNVTSTKRP